MAVHRFRLLWLGQPALLVTVRLVTATALWPAVTAASGLVTAGCAVAGAFQLPGQGAALSPEGRAMLRSAGWWSAGHAAALVLPWRMAPATGSVDGAVAVFLAAAVMVGAPLVRRRVTAAAVAGAAVLAGLPPLVGQPNHMLGHQLVMTAEAHRPRPGRVPGHEGHRLFRTNPTGRRYGFT